MSTHVVRFLLLVVLVSGAFLMRAHSANTRRFVDLSHVVEHGMQTYPGLPAPEIADHLGYAQSRAITAADFAGLDVRGKAVLVHTGWARHWRTGQYFHGHPYLTGDAARHLRDQGAVLVGIDSLNIDDMDDKARTVHTVLLGAGIPVVEHLRRLEQLPAAGFRFTAVPVKVRGMGTFPVRAYAVL